MILFVDDEPREMDSYRRELELSGFTVVFKSAVDDALKYLDEHPATVDLLILDVMMSPGVVFKGVPDKGLRAGVHFYQRIRRTLPRLPVIVFSNVNDYALRQQFANEDNCWLFQKEDLLPFELADKVKDILGTTRQTEEA